MVHTIGVEGHLPVPGTIVLRGRRPRPWLVTAVATPTTATLTDLKGGGVDVALSTLHPDHVARPDHDRSATDQHP